MLLLMLLQKAVMRLALLSLSQLWSSMRFTSAYVGQRF